MRSCYFCTLALFVFLTLLVSVSISIRPRGVDPHDSSKYQGKTFTCHSGSKTIPISAVNDNFCDCPDGSDEPGTSACSSSSGDPKETFYCQNFGYVPRRIFASRVDDGICDCCDGSDEPKGVCPNTCRNLGTEMLAEAQAELRRVEKAIAKRQTYVSLALTEMKKQQDKIDSLEAQIATLGPEVTGLLKVKEDFEETEKVKREEFRRIRRKELLHSEFEDDDDDDDDEDLDVKVALDEAKRKLDEDITRARNPKKEMEKEKEKPDFTKLSHEELLDRIANMTATLEELKKELAEKDARVVQLEEELAQDKLIEKLQSEVEEFKTAEATEARKKYEDANDRLTNLKNDLEEAQKVLKTDFGPDNVFYAMKDKCFTTKKKKYDYEMCPFQKAAQKEGSRSTSLGDWVDFPSDTDYSVFKFDGGQHCWKGPKRSLTITVVCGGDEKLTKIDEPNMCVYTAVFETPAACSEATLLAVKDRISSLGG